MVWLCLTQQLLGSYWIPVTECGLQPATFMLAWRTDNLCVLLHSSIHLVASGRPARLSLY